MLTYRNSVHTQSITPHPKTIFLLKSIKKEWQSFRTNGYVRRQNFGNFPMRLLYQSMYIRLCLGCSPRSLGNNKGKRIYYSTGSHQFKYFCNSSYHQTNGPRPSIPLYVPITNYQCLTQDLYLPVVPTCCRSHNNCGVWYVNFLPILPCIIQYT